MSKPKQWSVRIYGQPAAQARPRFAGGRSYRAGRSVQWEADAAHTMAKEWEAAHGPPEGRDEPLSVSALAIFKRPGRMVWKRKPMVREIHHSKPDIDNVLKSILDGATLAGIIKDDALVHQVHIVKFYAAGGEVPRVEITFNWGCITAPKEKEKT